MILVSACLVGENCRYNGKAKPNQAVLEYLKGKQYIAICPECEANLPIPRLPCEILGGEGQDVLEGKAKILNRAGTDLTREFMDGAEKILATVKDNAIDTAILKEGSPSCGVHRIHTGNFDRKTKKGMGLCARLLHNHGIDVFSEKDIKRLLPHDAKPQ